jgi:hypothetical protein
MTEENGVIQVTGLTPDPNVPVTPPAAPPDASGVAQQFDEQPADVEDTQQDATAQAPAAPEGEAPKKPSRGVQKALDRLTERATRAEQEAQRSSETAKQLAAALAAMHSPQPQAPQEQDPEPQPNQFTSWDDYTRNVAAWSGRQEARRVTHGQMLNFFSNLTEVQRQNAEVSHQAALNHRIAQATEKAPERIPDWDDVVASDLPLTPTIHRAIARAPDPALAMHYLATHPQDHMRLVRMAPEDAAYVAGQLFAPQRTAISRAPPPARTVGGRSTGANAYRDDFTPAQHKAWYERNQRG